jgi:hypothetical protein
MCVCACIGRMDVCTFVCLCLCLCLCVCTVYICAFCICVYMCVYSHIYVCTCASAHICSDVGLHFVFVKLPLTESNEHKDRRRPPTIYLSTPYLSMATIYLACRLAER